MGPPGASAAVVDEGPQAGRESVGLGQVYEMSSVWPLFDLQVGQVIPQIGALAGVQVVSEHAQARNVDARHRRLDLPLQLTWVVAKQPIPVAEDNLLADVLALECARAKRLGDVLEPMLCW